MTTQYPYATNLTHVLAFDVEASGQTPLTGDLLEFAGCLWEIGAKSPAAEIHFVLTINPEKRCHRTFEEFWNNPEKGKDGKSPLELWRARIKAENLTPTDPLEAAVKLVAWARKIYDEHDGRVAIITDTSGFDWSFMSDLLARVKKLPEGPEEGNNLPLSLNYLFGKKYQPVRDMNSFYMGAGGSFQKWGARDCMLEKLAFEFPDWVKAFEHDHDPRNDARSIAVMASYVLSLGREANKKRKSSDSTES